MKAMHSAMVQEVMNSSFPISGGLKKFLVENKLVFVIIGFYVKIPMCIFALQNCNSVHFSEG